MRELVNASKAVADSLIPKGVEDIDLSFIQNRVTFSRLSEIPLPTFSGEFRERSAFYVCFFKQLTTRIQMEK